MCCVAVANGIEEAEKVVMKLNRLKVKGGDGIVYMMKATVWAQKTKRLNKDMSHF